MTAHAPEILSERLVIRPGRGEDVPAVMDFYMRNRVFLEIWEPTRPEGFYTAAWWKNMLERSEREFRAGQSLRLFLFCKTAPRRVTGSVNFTNFARSAFHACHLGYNLDEAEQGKGLMTEALAACLPFVFRDMHVHRVMANYIPRNARSGRVLDRLGFRREGEARDYLLINGRWEDHILTSLVNPDWTPPPTR
jgi:[ribosomal protein S5]-alanine N-acetyltransferase